MPQNNPPPSNSKSETFSFGVQGVNFRTIDGGLTWVLEVPISIPNEFTSIEYVHYIRTVNGNSSWSTFFYSSFADGTITDISQSPITWPIATGGGAPGDYPLMAKGGLGPAFFNSQPITPVAIDQVGSLSTFVYMYAANNANDYQDTSLSAPLIFALVLTTSGG